MRGSRRCRTPGSNGAPRSSCKTRRCIRSPNGVGSDFGGCAGRRTPRRSRGHAAPDWPRPCRIRSSARAVVDIPLPSDRAMILAPEELRRRQLAAIVAWVVAGARSQPIVLVVEDLQWADPTSLDVLRSLAERGGQAPLFLVTTSRPEFRSSWAMRSHHSIISLAPLDRAQVLQMVRELASSQALSKDVVEGVSERTGGVPLFIEEVTRLLLERDQPGGVQAIPLTLQQSLAARLDRLGPRARSRRLARCWDGISPILCCATSPN